MSEIFGFWARETISNVRRNRLMSLLAVSTVTVGLFVLGAFYLAWGSVQSAVGAQTQKLDLVVILNRDVTPARRKQIYDAVRMPQIKKLTFVSKEKALQSTCCWLRPCPRLARSLKPPRYTAPASVSSLWCLTVVNDVALVCTCGC